MVKSRFFIPLLISMLSMPTLASQCFQDPEGEGGNQQKKQQRDSMMAEMEDPKMDLFMCSIQGAMDGIRPEDVLDEICGCQEAVDKLCDMDNGQVVASGGADAAWCAVFESSL